MDIASYKDVPRWIGKWFQTIFRQNVQVKIFQSSESKSTATEDYFWKEIGKSRSLSDKLQ